MSPALSALSPPCARPREPVTRELSSGSDSVRIFTHARCRECGVAPEIMRLHATFRTITYHTYVMPHVTRSSGAHTVAPLAPLDTPAAAGLLTDRRPSDRRSANPLTPGRPNRALPLPAVSSVAHRAPHTAVTCGCPPARHSQAHAATYAFPDAYAGQSTALRDTMVRRSSNPSSSGRCSRCSSAAGQPHHPKPTGLADRHDAAVHPDRGDDS